VFRQVVSYRWADGVTEDEKSAMRQSLAGLLAIPELSSLRFADDARHFEGNFDVVAVMDFPDFAAARRYVADERHQAYIRDFASKLIGERVVVQHDWAVHDLVGVHHVTLPVSDVARSRDWYALAFGLAVMSETTDIGAGEVTMVHPSAPIEVVLRHDPIRAQALAGFDAIAFTLATVEDLEALVTRLDAAGIAHGAPTSSGTGVHLDVIDPDGLVVQLTTLLP
jgi:catechol 2,3-dioxygenase-like lactoylglutathione lyase family enzyme